MSRSSRTASGRRSAHDRQRLGPAGRLADLVAPPEPAHGPGQQPHQVGVVVDDQDRAHGRPEPRQRALELLAADRLADELGHAERGRAAGPARDRADRDRQRQRVAGRRGRADLGQQPLRLLDRAGGHDHAPQRDLAGGRACGRQVGRRQQLVAVEVAREDARDGRVRRDDRQRRRGRPAAAGRLLPDLPLARPGAGATGAKAPVSGFVFQALDRREDGPVRVGFTVSKKVGNAAERNRVRRRLREVVRLAPAGR